MLLVMENVIKRPTPLNVILMAVIAVHSVKQLLFHLNYLKLDMLKVSVMTVVKFHAESCEIQ